MHSDFNRDAHCLLGLPIDVISLEGAEHRINKSASSRTPCFVSTPNLDFLLASLSDTSFRNSVLDSDLSLADGMPLVWIARLLGIPIQERVAGSSVFERLRQNSGNPLSVFFFGGPEGVAKTACQILNSEGKGLSCVGYINPGFGSIEEMSNKETIQIVNASNADFLVVSLGARKGQAWIEYNREKITIPVISHLGAVVNFVAGTVKRAPEWMQHDGLEWLWRIEQDHKLWHRYLSDGLMLLKLLVSRVAPYMWFMYWHKPKLTKIINPTIKCIEEDVQILIQLQGTWIQNNLTPLRLCFSNAVNTRKGILIDFQHVTYVDSAFIGLLLLLYGNLEKHEKKLSLMNLKKSIRQIFHYSGADFLLESHNKI